MRSAGARKMTNMRVAEKMHVTVPESDAVRVTAERDNKNVKEAWMTVGEARRRWHKIGNNANAWIESRVRAKTAKSVVKRDARTTDAETAAFFDKTEVKRSRAYSSESTEV